MNVTQGATSKQTQVIDANEIGASLKQSQR